MGVTEEALMALERLQAEAAQLRQRVADLAEFAQHKPWCDKVSGEPGCDCGLDSAMTFTDPPAARETP